MKHQSITHNADYLQLLADKFHTMADDLAYTAHAQQCEAVTHYQHEPAAAVGTILELQALTDQLTRTIRNRANNCLTRVDQIHGERI